MPGSPSTPARRPSTAIFLPVKNGMPLLEDVLAAAAAQGADDLLVIDSGSTDGSQDVARRAGFTVVEIPPKTFNHGRTRNLALEHTDAEVIAYLTQDASPVEGWLDAYLDAFALDERIAVAFGPHLPRPGTSPMIARELLQFFAPFSPDGRVTIHRALDEPGYHPEFLHNANAAYRRSALLEVPFRDIAYAEDQAYARDALAAGWHKAYAPGAGVLHAHDFPWAQFMRRYFDEYRGLRETAGLRMSFYPKGIARDAVLLSTADRRWLQDLDVRAGTRNRWFARALAHHGGRRIAAVLGGRADVLPDAVQRVLSLEGRAGATGNPQDDAEAPIDVNTTTEDGLLLHAAPFSSPLAIVEEVQRLGAAPSGPTHGPGPWRIVVVAEIAHADDPALDPVLDLVAALEARGHACEVRIHDPEHRVPHHRREALRARAAGRPVPPRAPITVGLDGPSGADVALATTWRAAYATLRLPDVGIRAFLAGLDGAPLRDASSGATLVQELWASDLLHRDDLVVLGWSPTHAAAASAVAGRPVPVVEPWTPSVTPRPDLARRDDTVVLFRPASDRHGGGVAGLVLDTVIRQRPGTRVVVCGPGAEEGLSFRHVRAGSGPLAEETDLLARGTIALLLDDAVTPATGLAALAGGLPVVTAALAGSDVSAAPPGVAAAAPTVPALAAAVIDLLDDPARRERLAAEGRAHAAERTVQRAAEQLERAVAERSAAPASGAR